MKKQTYYLGLDIGTDSVGYAVTDEQYNLIKFKGEPAWGVTIFDAASTNEERRGFRTARRRLERRKQRIHLLQEIFAKEIAKVDERFFVRLQEARLYRDEAGEQYTLFNDADYSDKDYYEQFPTIHHLIAHLMKSEEPQDIRLVYLACAWLVAHRGHFLSNISKENLAEIKDFSAVYASFRDFFVSRGYEQPWDTVDEAAVSDVLKKKLHISAKQKALTAVLYGNGKPSKEVSEEFPFSREAIVKLLAGGTVKLKDLFCKEEYAELGSLSLSMDDDKMGEIMSAVGEDFDLIAALRSVYDWTVLVDTLGEARTISEAKVTVYEKHKSDLQLLKRIIRTYKPEKYDDVFRAQDKDNYTAYAYHTNDGNTSEVKKKGKEEFSKYILGILKGIEPDETDAEDYARMVSELEMRQFLPKQKDTNNRVIPHQLMWYELHAILQNASKYAPFLTEADENSLSNMDKIESVFLFRIPYFVGPLNRNSKHAWIQRKAEGKILPWNFKQMVDLDASEQCFIEKMTNTCTYLPGEPVLPKDSLLYHKFMVLNEINNLSINGERISVELKQNIYRELFLRVKKVTRKRLIDYLLSNGVVRLGEEDSISGIDEDIRSNLAPQIAYQRLLNNGVLKEDEVEEIIKRASYAEDKSRLNHYLESVFPAISAEDRKYICSIKCKDFGRLSGRFLCGLEGTCKETGEVMTILGALWNTQNNLMELLSSKFTFMEEINAFRVQYYAERPQSLEKRLDGMYLSNAVKRPIYRTLDIVNDLYKAFGAPKKIFVEMTRGGDEEQKGKRTKSRYEQIMELYEQCRDEDVRILKQQLEALGERADNMLRGDKLFLYYMQLGKSMYSGKPIDITKLASKEYDIDHIYPQAYVKDDSILNNKVLVLSTENGAKQDVYPIEESIRKNMYGYWEFLKDKGLITEEKFKRLVRHTPFTDDEKYGFINRQLTETSQSTKAVATLLAERFPDTEIIYSKAKLTSDFRQEFEIWKSRTYNDLHHAVDAYLNIVVGNVYHMKFTCNFNVHSKYSIKTKTIFRHPLICNGQTIWDGENMLGKVKRIACKNNAHFTKYAFMKKGGLFDQMPVPAGEDLTPLKKGLPTEKYGGYNKAGIQFYLPVKYRMGKKEDIFIMPVELLYGDRFLQQEGFALEYTYERLSRILGKKVDEVSFPMGMRPWKVNTVLSFDGFRGCITGTANKGAKLLVQPIMQFSSDPFWKYYVKKLERLAEKMAANPKYVYDPEYDKVTSEKNLELYELYIDKLQNSIYMKRGNSPIDILINGRDRFNKADIATQTKTLLNIQQIFGRVNSGVDLSALDGKTKGAAKFTLSTGVSNWTKYFREIRIIDMSPSGLWEKQSENILSLL